jgi:hypothetical protein
MSTLRGEPAFDGFASPTPHHIKALHLDVRDVHAAAPIVKTERRRERPNWGLA